MYIPGKKSLRKLRNSKSFPVAYDVFRYSEWSLMQARDHLGVQKEKTIFGVGI